MTSKENMKQWTDAESMMRTAAYDWKDAMGDMRWDDAYGMADSLMSLAQWMRDRARDAKTYDETGAQ